MVNERIFANSFWGEKNLGFESLTQNMKVSYKNTTEFCDFLREINSVEENYAKSLAKLSKQAHTYSNSGSYKLWWKLLHSLLDKSITLRCKVESERMTIWKDVQKYLEDLQKKQRTLKESESGTQEVVHSFQVATIHLQKAKDLYHIRYKEYEKVRLNEAHSAKDMEKAEAKLKKAQDDYKYSVEKYNNLRVQFVDKMRISCDHFQHYEFAHLTRMCEYFGRFSVALVDFHRELLSLVSESNMQRNVELTADRLLLNMVEERGTGDQEPLTAEFEDVEVATAFLNSTACSGGLEITSLSSTPCPSYSSVDTSGFRAASALPAFRSQESPNEAPPTPLKPSWQSSLSEIGGTQNGGLGRRTGNLFQRRNRQNSTGPEVDSASVHSGGAPGSFAQKLASVRNLARLPRKTSNSPSEQNPKPMQAQIAAICPKVDAEGYTIRSDNSWSTGHSRSHSSGSNASSSSSPSEKTFKGIKVTIRPLGDVVGGCSVAPTSVAKLPLAARDFRRSHTSAEQPLASAGAFESVEAARSLSAATAPLVPVLPPPPPSRSHDSASSRHRAARPSLRRDIFSQFSANSKATDQAFNPFGLEKSEEDTPTPQLSASWEAVFDTPQEKDDVNSGLIDFHEDGSDDKHAQVEVANQPPEPNLPETKPALTDSWRLVKEDSDEFSLYSVCHAPLAAIEDDENSPPPPPPPPQPMLPPPPPTTSTSVQPITRSPVEPPRALLPPPLPPLPIAIALTETWRAQFPRGGGSSFTTMERPAQSLFGQVTLAVAREDLRLLVQSHKSTLRPLVLVFSRAERMRNMKATFSGATVILEGASSEKARYRVTIPGDLLFHFLLESHKEGSLADEEYTRLVLLDYGVESSSLQPPITMCTFWRCEEATTDFRLDYFVQWPKWSITETEIPHQPTVSDISCQDLRVNLLVDGGVSRMQSRPLGTWNGEQMRASWSIPLTAVKGTEHPSQQQTHPGVDVAGNICAKFFLSRGPGTPQPVALQFCRDGGCLPSGAVLTLGPESLSSSGGSGGYRLTMCKYRLLGDRYFCDPPVPHGGGLVRGTHNLSPLSPTSRAQYSS